MGYEGTSKYLGTRCNKLVVERVTYRQKDRTSFAICRCDCGRRVEVEVAEIRKGRRVACGKCLPRGGARQITPKELCESVTAYEARKAAQEHHALLQSPRYRRPTEPEIVLAPEWMH